MMGVFWSNFFAAVAEFFYHANLRAETYNRDLQSSDIFTIQDEIIDRVAATVADNFGVLVRSMVASLEGKSDDELSGNEQYDVHFYNFSDLPICDRIFGTYMDTTEFVNRCGFDETLERELVPMLLFKHMD